MAICFRTKWKKCIVRGKCSVVRCVQ